MADQPERIERAPEAPSTTTTVIRERGSSGGATGIVMALILLIVVAGGIYLFSQGTKNQTANDDPAAEAGGNIGT